MTVFSVLLRFPGLLLRRQLIEANIGGIAARADLPFLERAAHGAVRLLEVGAVGKAALTYVGRKLRKIILELLLRDRLHHLDLKGSEAGRVRDKRAVAERIELDVSRRVLAAAEMLADGVRRDRGTGEQDI